MEERKKRKEEKKKREAAQKKATGQKNKVPEPPKLGVTSPSPPAASVPSSASAAAASGGGNSGHNNARRPAGVHPQPVQQQQQPSPRYPPREVPPRFRHQEQKQLLKRGQQLPGLAANLGASSKLPNGLPGGCPSSSEQPAAGREEQSSSSQKHPDLSHSTLGAHDEDAHQGAFSSSSDPSTNREQVPVDGSDRAAWPSVAGSDPEPASESADADSASSSGSETGLALMASRGTDVSSAPNGIGHGSPARFAGSGHSNNGGGTSRPWGLCLSSTVSTGPSAVEASKGTSDSSSGRTNTWGGLTPSPGGGLNPSTLNASGSRGAWPVLESSGHLLKGPGGGGGGSQGASNPSGSSSLGSWGGLPENGCDSPANGTRKALQSGQPQNLNPEVNGPNNNTTNSMTSSLPNSAGSVQPNEAAGGDAGAWGRSSLPLLPTSPATGGPSAPHLSNGEAKIGGTAWAGAYSSTFSSGDRCSDSSGRAGGDTVNATLTQPALGGANSSTSMEMNGDKGAASGLNLSWGGGAGSGGGQRGWGGPVQSPDFTEGEWNQLPSNQHPSENGTKKFPSAWQSGEEESVSMEVQSAAASPVPEQQAQWAKASPGGSEVGPDGLEERPGAEGAGQERRKVDQYALLQSIVSRTGLDPRVLSNSGWGQTPIKQNTAWDAAAASPRGKRKADNGTEAWGGCSTGEGVERPGLNGPTGWGEPKSAARWGDSKAASGSQGGWERPAAPAQTKGNQSWAAGAKDDKPSLSPWSEAEKFKPGWAEGQKASPGWSGPAADGWGENLRSNHWGEARKSSSGSSDSDRSTTSGWKETGKAGAAHWGGGRANPSPSSGWEEPAPKTSQSQGWGEPPKQPSRSQSWEAGKPPGSPDWTKQQDVGSWGAQPALSKAQGVGWLGGRPAPAPAKEEEEPTGWEEPSPESIRRKMEIDDGTSAWGDPSRYNYKNVNMWDKNTPRGSGSSDQQAHGPPQRPPSHAPPGASLESGGNSGWGEPPPAATTVDNGTAAWGKPVDTGTSWGDSLGDAGGAGSWGCVAISQPAPHKAGPKSMQAADGWCGGDMPLAGSRPTSWEEAEEVEIGMWSGGSAQDVGASLNWPSYAKRLPSKGTTKNNNKQEETWINPFVKQFANLNFSRESPEEILHSNKMDMSGGVLPDKRMEMEKHSLVAGDYSRVVGKGPGTRPQISKESSMDRSPYFDKDGLLVADDPANVPFLPGQNAKPPPPSSALPNQALAGLGMQNLNSVRQNGSPSTFGTPAAQSRNLQPPPSAQPLNPSQPHPRAQVPPPLLSPQVPISLLKYAPNNGGGLSPLFGPQQVAMLNQLSQLSQLQRLLAQQRKAQAGQRNTPAGGRQPEQQSRSLGLPQPCQLDPGLLLKQQQQQQLQPPALKSFLESELQKGPMQHSGGGGSSPFSNFPLGLSSNLNVNVDLGSIKEPQSRLRKWTTVDSMDQNISKNGAISSGFRLEDAPFVPYDFMNSSNSPASPPGSIGDGWPRAKSPPNGSSSVNWPPEFRPGEPWKGYPNIDPETDPYITPGSVTNNLSINTVREADHLRDRSTGSSSCLNTALPSTSAWTSVRASTYNVPLSSTAQSTSARNSDSKSTWSPASMTNTSLAHELWKVPLPTKGIVPAPSRPPPGLTGHKPPLSAWDNPLRLGGGWNTSEARYTPGSPWAESGSGRLTSCALILKNLTPQIDGSTLRTLCMQHGPLITFHLNLPHGNALVRYSSKEEVVKAQKSLHMCVLGNTTILAELASEEEISRFFAQGQSLTPSPPWQSLGSGQSRLGSAEGGHPFPGRSELSNHWNGAGLQGAGGGELPGTSLWGSPTYSPSLWGSLGGGGDSSPSPLNAFLSIDPLGGPGGSPCHPLSSFSE